MGRALLTTLTTLLLLGATALFLQNAYGGPAVPALAKLEALDLAALGTALRLAVWAALAILLLLLVLRVTVALALLFRLHYAPLAYLGQALLLPVVRRTAGGITAGVMVGSQLVGSGGLASAAGGTRPGSPAAPAVVTVLAKTRAAASPADASPARAAAAAAEHGPARVSTSLRTPRGRRLAHRRLGAGAWLREGAITYTVQPGDSLSWIAKRFYGDLLAYPRLFRANRGRVQPDGDRLRDAALVRPGWRFLIPLPSAAVTLHGAGQLRYIVQSGDTLDKIAAGLLGSWQRYTELVALNAGVPQADGASLQDPNLIHAGWVLRVPAEGISPPLAHPRSPGAHALQQHPAPRQGAHRRARVAGLRLRSRAPRSRHLPARPAAAGLPDAAALAAPPPRVFAVLRPLRAGDRPQPPPPVQDLSEPHAGPRPLARQVPAPAAPDEGAEARAMRPRSTPRSTPTVRLPDGRLLPTALAAAFLALLAVGVWRRTPGRGRRPAPLAVDSGTWEGATGPLATALAGRLRGDEANKMVPLLRALDAALRERGLGGPRVRWVREGEESLTVALVAEGDHRAALLAAEEGLAARVGCPLALREQGQGVLLSLRQVPVALWSADSAAVSPPAGAGALPHPVPLLVGLGAGADGQALHVNLEEEAPLLVASSAAGGSGTLLLTLLVHLAAQARPAQLQLLIAADPGGSLGMLLSLPHLATPVADPGDPAAMTGLLDLAEEALEERQATTKAGAGSLPALVLAIDRLEEVAADAALCARLTRLVQDGRAAGVHVVATTEDVQALAGTGLLDSVGGRLVLHLPREEVSRVLVGTNGATTLGQGEVLWRSQGEGALERLQAFALAASEAREIVAAIAGAGPAPAPGGPRGDEEQTPGADTASREEDTGAGGAVPALAPPRAAPLVSVRLLRDGVIGVTVAGQALDASSDGLARQPRELLAYLALQRGRPVPRDRILEALWPEKEPEKSINSFHQALRFLRAGLAGGDGMPPAGEIVREQHREYLLAPDLFWVDALEFEEVLDQAAAAERAEDTARQGVLLRRAVDLYGGDLLGDQIPLWVEGERGRLRERYLGALRALSRWHEARGELAEALTLAIRLADAEPLTEAYHRRVMRLQAKGADTEALMRRYALLRDILRAEGVGTEPDERTQALYRRLRDQAQADGEDSATNEAAS